MGVPSPVMRWLLVLSLAACASPDWHIDPATDETRPLLLKYLRGADGDANVIMEGRCYVVRAGALRPEIRACTSAAAEAWERLVVAARAQSTTWISGPNFLLLETGIDVRSVGGIDPQDSAR